MHVFVVTQVCMWFYILIAILLIMNLIRVCLYRLISEHLKVSLKHGKLVSVLTLLSMKIHLICFMHVREQVHCVPVYVSVHTVMSDSSILR